MTQSTDPGPMAVLPFATIDSQRFFRYRTQERGVYFVNEENNSWNPVSHSP